MIQSPALSMCNDNVDEVLNCYCQTYLSTLNLPLIMVINNDDDMRENTSKILPFVSGTSVVIEIVVTGVILLV